MARGYLKLKLNHRTQWKEVQEGTSEDAVFCPAENPPETGTSVRIEVQFGNGSLFLLDGQVIWRRPVAHRRVPAGVGVAVDAGSRATKDFIDGWAGGALKERRASPRLPLRLRAIYRVGNRNRVNFTRNISEAGLYLHSSELADVHDSIAILLAPGDLPRVELVGRVARCSEPGKPSGMGISFSHSDTAARRLSDVFVELKRRLFEGIIPRGL